MTQFIDIQPGQPLVWFEGAREAADEFGLAIPDVEAIVRNPAQIELDPSTAVVEQHTERRRRGDVLVVVRFRGELSPLILGVYVIAKGHEGTAEKGRRGSTTGRTGGSSAPTTLREFKRRLVEARFQIEPGGKGERVLDPDGKFFYSLHISPSDHRSLVNMWADVKRKALKRGIEL